MNQPPANRCPTEKTLRSFLSGGLDEPLLRQIGQHLSSCKTCDTLAKRVEASSDFRFPYGRWIAEDTSAQRTIDLGVSALHARRKTRVDDETLLEMFDLPGYEIQSVLGRGGMGVVFKALQHSTNRMVALKVINPDSSGNAEQNPSLQNRFAQEIEAAARIEHDNVVTVFDGEINDQFQSYAMELVDGDSLWQRVQDGIEIDDAARFIRDAALGLQAAHESGILHRDVKPQNILISGSKNRAMLSDFGLAKDLQIDNETIVETQANWIVGTLDYLSPEQVDGSAELSPLSDIYSLGASLYFCLTGTTPFSRASVTQQLNAIANQEPVPPKQLRADIHPDLEAICLKCLDKRPENRFSSAAALAADIERYLNSEPTRTRPVGPARQLTKWAGRNPTSATLATVIFGLLMVGLIAALIVNQRTGHLNRDLKLSIKKADSLSEQLQESLQSESKARDDAEKALNEAQKITRSFSLEVANSPELLQDGMQELRRELLLQAKQQLEFFLVDTRRNSSGVADAVTQMIALARIESHLGNMKSAADEFDRAEILCRKQLGATTDTDNSNFWNSQLAHCLHGQALVNGRKGQFEVATELNAESWQIINGLEKEESFRRSRLLLDIGTSYADSLTKLGKKEEAGKIFGATQLIANRLMEMVEQKIADGTEPRSFKRFFMSFVQFANLRTVALRYDVRNSEALALLEKGVSALEQVDSSLLSPMARKQRAGIWQNLSIFLKGSDKEKSFKYRRLAVDEFRKLMNSNPKVPSFKYNFVLAARNLGNALADRGHIEAGGALIREASLVVDALIKTNPDSDRYQYAQSMVFDSKVVLHGANQNYQEALKWLDRKLEIAIVRTEKIPDSHSRVYSVGFTHFQIAECSILLNRPLVAAYHLLKASIVSQRLPMGMKNNLDRLVDSQFKKLFPCFLIWLGSSQAI